MRVCGTGFTGFSACNRRFDGSFTRIDSFAGDSDTFRHILLLRFFCLTCARLRLTRLAGGNHLSVIRYASGLNHDRLRAGGLFFTHAGEGCVNCLLIFCGRLDGGFFVAFSASGFFPLQACLTRLKARFSFGVALFFLRNGVNLGFFLTEILDQRDITWADPRAGTALNAIGQIVRSGFVMLLAFTEPVKLLRQQIRRAGIGTGATANTAFLFLLLTHFTGRGRQQAVGNFHHRNIKPGQGKAHQWPTHNDQLFSGGTKTGMFQQVTHRCPQTCPDVSWFADALTGQCYHTFGERFAVDNGPLNGISGADVLHQHTNIR